MPLIINITCTLYFGQIKFLIDSGVHSKHVQVIRCEITPKLVEISSDV
jgi:hypothetical protein